MLLLGRVEEMKERVAAWDMTKRKAKADGIPVKSMPAQKRMPVKSMQPACFKAKAKVAAPVKGAALVRPKAKAAAPVKAAAMPPWQMTTLERAKQRRWKAPWRLSRAEKTCQDEPKVLYRYMSVTDHRITIFIT